MKTYNTDVYVGVLFDFHTSLCVVLSPENRRPRGTVSGFLLCPTALTTWTQCPAPPPSTAADWVVIRRGLSHCGEQQDPAQSATVSEIVTLSLPYITNTQYSNLQRSTPLNHHYFVLIMPHNCDYFYFFLDFLQKHFSVGLLCFTLWMLDKVAGSKILHARQQKLSDLNTARECWDIRELFILFITLLPLCMVE